MRRVFGGVGGFVNGCDVVKGKKCGEGCKYESSVCKNDVRVKKKGYE